MVTFSDNPSKPIGYTWGKIVSVGSAFVYALSVFKQVVLKQNCPNIDFAKIREWAIFFSLNIHLKITLLLFFFIIYSPVAIKFSDIFTCNKIFGRYLFAAQTKNTHMYDCILFIFF